MPFDPQEYEVKPDLSLDGLIQWLEGQDPDTEYCYMDTGGCLMHSFLSATGLHVSSVGGNYYRLREAPFGERHFFPDDFGMIAVRAPHTYGAALSRARALRGS